MKITDVSINNFLSIKSINTSLDRAGLTLILGSNKDSKQYSNNGSGKSAFFEAVIWGLFGETLRKDVTLDGLIREGQKTLRVTVEVDPEDGSEPYVITRSRESKKSELKVSTKNGNELFPSNSIIDIQKHLNKWLGLDFNTFVNSVFFGNKLAKFFMTANDAERKDLLDSIISTINFDSAFERVKNELRTIENDLIRWSEEEKYLKTSIKDTEQLLIEEQNKDIKAQEEYLKQVNIIDEKLADLETNRQSFKSKLEIIDKKLLAEKATYSSKYKEISSKYLKDINENKDILSQLNSNKFKKLLEVENEVKKKYDSLLVDYKEKKIAYSKTQSDIDTRLKTVENELSKKYGIISTLGTTEKKYLKLIPGSSCPACFQNVSPDHITMMREEVAKELANATKEYEELEYKKNRFIEDVQRPFIEEYQTFCADLASIENEQKSKIMSAKFEVESSYKEEQLNLNKKISDLELAMTKETGAAEKEFTLLTSGLKQERTIVQTDLVTCDNNLLALKEKKEYLKTEAQKYSVIIKSLTSRLDKYNDSLVQAQNNTKQTKEKKEIYSFFTEAFGPKGIRSFLFEMSLPYLTERANYYSTLLTGGTVTIEISPVSKEKTTGKDKEKLTVITRNSIGGSLYNANSDGERRRIDLCVLLSLQDLISSRSSRIWNTMIADEIYDALDDVGIVTVVELLRSMKNKTIFVISHNSSLKQYFDEVMIIEKEDGCSSLKE